MRSAVGTTDPFSIEVGLHQEPSLSPYLFNVLMKVLLDEAFKEAPLTILLADDIVLVAERQQDLRERLEERRRSLEEFGLRII